MLSAHVTFFSNLFEVDDGLPSQCRCWWLCLAVAELKAFFH